MKLSDLSEDDLQTIIARNTSNDIIKTINNILLDYDDFEWDGFLYRCGPPGSYYHVAKIGAQFYKNMGTCKQYNLPQLNKVLILDSETLDMFQIIAGLTNQDVYDLEANGTWVEDIDECLPILRNAGFDGVVIHGETGRDVTGPPLEVILLSKDPTNNANMKNNSIKD